MIRESRKTAVLFCLSLIATLSMAVSGCGKEEYVKQEYHEELSAVGSRYLPAKVDILMVVDNTASLNTAMSTVQNQLSGFVSQLNNNFWDYHLGKITIQNPSNISKVLVNPKYNTNKLDDGTVISVSGIVPTAKAITDASQFSILEGTILSNGADYTYDNIYSKLLSAKSDTSTNFFRNDAMLVIIVVTNGAEYTVDPNHNNGIDQTKLASHASKLIGLKGNSKFIRFYPIASYSYKSGASNSYCLVSGGTAWPGESYFQMNNYIGGLSKFSSGGEVLNFCNSSSLNNVLSSIEQDLKAIRQAYVYSKIVFKEEPIESSIRVFKNGQLLKTIAEDPVNGWKYIGFQSNQPTITQIKNEDGTFTNLNPGIAYDSGYMIQLNGTSRMIGSDVPSVEYQKK